MHKFTRLLVLCFSFFILSGCATTHFVKTNPEFKQKMTNIKTVGILLPIEYESNRETNATALQTALIKRLQTGTSFQLKTVSRDIYGDKWDATIQRVANDSQEVLKEIELEGIWKDKKNGSISRTLFEDIKLFKTLDPGLDALLIVKCKHTYGNAWTNGLIAFGLVGGLVATATAEKDPVIGSHVPGDNDTYTSILLVDLNTAETLWYNFSLKVGLDITRDKHATVMAQEMLYGLVN